MTTTTSILRAAEAATQFKLPDWMNPDSRLLVHHGDARIDDDLRLDWVAGWQSGEFAAKWMAQNAPGETLSRESIDGLIVTGNLHATGSIINADIDSGPYLLVLGNVIARAIVSSGAFMKIKGNADIAEYAFGCYNHGGLDVWGTLKCAIYVNEDHGISIGTNTFLREGAFRDEDLRTVFRYEDRAASPRLEDDDPLPAALAKIVMPGLMTWGDLRRAMSEGQSILRKGDVSAPQTIVDWVPLVWKNQALLKRVPATLKTEDFYLALFAEASPMSALNVMEIISSMKAKDITRRICVAALQLSPKSLLRLPDSFDLQKTYDDCFASVRDPQKVYQDIPEQYRTEAMRRRLK
jgi:hypothetical protein